MSAEQEKPMFEVTQYGEGKTLVEVNDHLDSTNAFPFGDTLNNLVDKGAKDITIDLSRTGYVSSAGLREMIAAKKKIMSQQGNIQLIVGLPSRTNTVLDTLDLSGLTEIFQITVVGGKVKK